MKSWTRIKSRKLYDTEYQYSIECFEQPMTDFIKSALFHATFCKLDRLFPEWTDKIKVPDPYSGLSGRLGLKTIIGVVTDIKCCNLTYRNRKITHRFQVDDTE